VKLPGRTSSAAEIYQVFLSILQVKGYAMVPAGKINKIVPAANVASYGFDTKVGPADERRVLDRYVTQVIPVEFTEAEDLKNLLQPLIPKTDSISAYGPTNLLIITTTESLLSRLSQIISVVDVAGAREEIRIIPVERRLSSGRPADSNRPSRPVRQRPKSLQMRGPTRLLLLVTSRF
jgi:general secretion pathway protein D